MSRILLALTILGAGVGVFHSARQSKIQLRQEASAARLAWLDQTQLVAVAKSDQAALMEHIRELKEALAQPETVAANPLWTVLQANRTGHLPAELKERLLEELGFNWQSSADYIVVSKDTVRELQINAIKDDRFTDTAATVLALTPAERRLVEAAIQRVQTDFNDWAVTHTERTEPKDDVVAQYTLQNDPAMSISNNFYAGLFNALGRERTELIMPSAWNLMNSIGISGEPTTMIVKRHFVGDEQRLEFQQWSPSSTGGPDGLSDHALPRRFLPVFPNGWADVAKREGFELPNAPQGK